MAIQDFGDPVAARLAAFTNFAGELFPLVFPLAGDATASSYQKLLDAFLAKLSEHHGKQITLRSLISGLASLGVSVEEAIDIIFLNVGLFGRGMLKFYGMPLDEPLRPLEIIGKAMARYPTHGIHETVQELAGDDPMLWREILRAANKQCEGDELRTLNQEFWKYLPGQSPFSETLMLGWCVPTEVPPLCFLSDGALLSLAAGALNNGKLLAAGLTGDTLRKRLKDACLRRAPKRLLFKLKRSSNGWSFYRSKGKGHEEYVPLPE